MYSKSFKNKASIFIPVLILVIVATYLGFFSKQTAAWYEPGSGTWTYRVAITVDPTKVDADLTDFPVYVDLSDLPAAFHTNVKSDGGDIRITTSDGATEIAREVVIYDAGTDTGEIHFKAPTLSNTVGTTFYIYYGNASASDYTVDATYGAENVWTNGYQGVWHMDDGTTLSGVDSTSNSNDGTVSTPIATTGKIDGAGGFNGSSDRILLNRTASLSQTTGWTLQAWTYPTSTPQGPGVIAEAYAGAEGSTNDTNVQYEIGFGINEGPGGSSTLKVGFYDGSWRLATDPAGNIPLNAWVHIAGSWNGTSLVLYKNGSQVASTNPGGTVPTGAGKFFIGRRHDAAGSVNFFPGYMDEVRISSSVRTSTWLSTEYNNQNSPSTFYSLGTAEENTVAPTVTTSAVTSIATTTATGNGNVTSDGGASITERGVVWNTSPTPTTAHSKATSAGTTGAFTASMTGLTASTTYYVRAYAINSIGTSYGSEETFTTDAESVGPATVVFLTTTGANTWTVPTDWNSASNTIEVIGGGAGGNAKGGGGGGAYSAISNLSLTSGASINYTVGTGGAVSTAGGDTWFNGASLGASSVGAKGGSQSSSGGAGGASASGIGTTKYSGGNGATGSSYGAGGGGGAAGPNGAGGNGGSSSSQEAGGGGGGGGGTNGVNAGTNGGNGGNNYLGSGSGSGGVGSGSAGSAGTNGGGGGGGDTSAWGGNGGAGQEWDATHGSGGAGGGSGLAKFGGSGGLYGGGGSGGGTSGFAGTGAQGIIVITYTPIEQSGGGSASTTIPLRMPGGIRLQGGMRIE